MSRLLAFGAADAAARAPSRAGQACQGDSRVPSSQTPNWVLVLRVLVSGAAVGLFGLGPLVFSGTPTIAQEGPSGGPPPSGSCAEDGEGDSVAGSAPAPLAVGLRRACAWHEADGRLTLYVEFEDGRSMPDDATLTGRISHVGGTATFAAARDGDSTVLQPSTADGSPQCDAAELPRGVDSTRLQFHVDCFAGGEVTVGDVVLERSASRDELAGELAVAAIPGLPRSWPAPGAVCAEDAEGDSRLADGSGGGAEDGLARVCAQWLVRYESLRRTESPYQAFESLVLSADLESGGNLRHQGFEPEQALVVTMKGREERTATITAYTDSVHRTQGWNASIVNANGGGRCGGELQHNGERPPQPAVSVHPPCAEQGAVSLDWALVDLGSDVTTDQAGTIALPRADFPPAPPAHCDEDLHGDAASAADVARACLLSTNGDLVIDVVPAGSGRVTTDHRVVTWVTDEPGDDPLARAETALGADGLWTTTVHNLRSVEDETAEDRPDACTRRYPGPTSGYHVRIEGECAVPGAAFAGGVLTAPDGNTDTFGDGMRTRLVAFPHPGVRLAAADAVGTALDWSLATFFAEGSAHALLGRDDDYADALASAGLQGALRAPLLFTPTHSLDDRVGEELLRMGATEVTVLGGEEAVAPAVTDELEELGVGVRRIGGRDRFETAALIAAEVGGAGWLVRGTPDPTVPSRAFADALGVSAVAGQTPRGILLTTPADLPELTPASMLTDWHAVGSPTAVSDEVIDEATTRGAAGYQGRLEGGNRAATAVALAEFDARSDSSDERQSGRVLVIDGYSSDAWASGLPVAAHSALTDLAVVIVDGPTVPPETARYLEGIPDGAGPSVICASNVVASACVEATDLARGGPPAGAGPDPAG